MAQQAQLTPEQAFQLNNAARNAVLLNSVEMIQQIYSTTVDPLTTPVLNISPRNVGLIRGFFVEVIGNITAGAGTLTRTNFGAANALTNITFTDLNNNQRHNTSGYHVALLNSARQGFAFGGVYAPTIPIDFASNVAIQTAPATILTTVTSPINFTYYVPLAYSPDDLRGSIYAGTTQATMNLQLTINNAPCAAAGDPLNKIYTGTTGVWSAAGVTVNVYQVYLDQLPRGQNGPILPVMDLNTIYGLTQGSQTGMVAAQDFPVPYSNFRDFLSTFLIYDQAGTFNPGTDINYFALQSANFTNLFKYSPRLAALYARQYFMADLPEGVYYFDHRRRPINTNQFGNMELVVNPITAAAQSQIITAWEYFAQINQLVGAGSMPGG